MYQLSDFPKMKCHTIPIHLRNQTFSNRITVVEVILRTQFDDYITRIKTIFGYISLLSRNLKIHRVTNQ